VCIVTLYNFLSRTSSQTVASKVVTVSSSNVRQLGGGGSAGWNGLLHHHLSVEELRLIQVKNWGKCCWYYETSWNEGI